MKKHSSKKKALLIALAVIVVLILGAVGAVYGVTHGFYRSSNYTSDEDAMKDFTNWKRECIIIKSVRRRITDATILSTGIPLAR